MTHQETARHAALTPVADFSERTELWNEVKSRSTLAAAGSAGAVYQRGWMG
jgi:hypothetical protein